MVMYHHIFISLLLPTAIKIKTRPIFSNKVCFVAACDKLKRKLAGIKKNITTAMRSGPPFHMSNFVKPLLQGCTVHHGNAIISSGSPLLPQRRQTADRATKLEKKGKKEKKEGKNTNTLGHLMNKQCPQVG